jgi:signal peptidase I
MLCVEAATAQRRIGEMIMIKALLKRARRLKRTLARLPRAAGSFTPIFDEIKGLALAIGLMLVATTAIAQPFIVPSGSMEPTLMVGDEIAAAKYAYGYGRYSVPFGLLPINVRLLDRPPERGDIVVFALPRDPRTTFVKRVIGLPGDRIQMQRGLLYINGTEVPRRLVGPLRLADDPRPALKYIETLPNGRTHDMITLGGSPLDDTPVFTVPSNSYFMMGDNRDNSLDSRATPEEGGVGFVPAENLIGRVDRVLFSVSPKANWLEALADPVHARVSRMLHAVE